MSIFMWKQHLQSRIIHCRFVENAPLSGYTTFKLGGPAALLAEPETEEALCALLDEVTRESIPHLLIGNGSNLLVRDGGFDGLVICVGPALSQVQVEGTTLTSQAGALLSKVAVAACEHQLAGLAFAHGIPGSLGGAVYMNAGAYGGEMCQVISSVRVWTPEGIKTYANEEMRFGYRHSRIMDEAAVVLSASMVLTPGNSDEIRAEMKELMRRRKEKQPLEYPSAGSFFKRPEGHYAGALIEGAGLKGFQIGGARISEKHAGFMIQDGSASAGDVLAVMQEVQKRVYDMYGVHLENEVRIVGQDT